MIRPAALSDIPAIEACAHAAYEMYVERIGKKPAPMTANFTQQLKTHSIHVLVHNDAVVGYVVYLADDKHMLLENVAVHPSHSAKGFGKQLIQHVEYQALSHDISSIVLYTNAAMTENLAMYPKLGYEQTHRIVEHGFDRVYFEKTLSPRP